MEWLINLFTTTDSVAHIALLYAIGIVLFKINFRMEKSFANNPFAVCGNDV